MWAHDGNDGVREAALGELDGLDEMVEPRDVEFAVGIDQLRRAAIFRHYSKDTRWFKKN